MKKKIIAVAVAGVLAAVSLGATAASAAPTGLPELNVSPSPATVGQPVTVSGTECLSADGTPGEVLVDFGGQPAAATVTTDGSWSVSVTPAKAGVTTISASCDVYYAYASNSALTYPEASLTVNAATNGGNGGNVIKPVVPGAKTWTPSESDMTASNAGNVRIVGSVVQGGKVTVYVGSERAGQQVRAFIFSTPIDLGTHTVAADGTIVVQLPSDLTGSHRIAIYDLDGNVIGWAAIEIPAAGGNGAKLATTGAEGNELLLVGGAVVLLAGAALLMRRRSALAVK